MKEKFTQNIQNDFWKSISTLDETRDQLQDLASILVGQQPSTSFNEDALQFALLGIDTSKSIQQLVIAGHLAECYVLLRWQLELTHLFYYLWKNPESYLRWKQGSKVRPKKVRQFFEETGFPSWHSTYDDWSSATHGNSVFVSNFRQASSTHEKSTLQLVLVGQILLNSIFLLSKENYILLQISETWLGDERNAYISKYQELSRRALECSEIQLSFENRVV